MSKPTVERERGAANKWPIADGVRDVTLAEPKSSKSPISSSDFGGRVRALRHERGLTLRELAGRSTLAASTLSKVENGQLSLSYDSILLLASGLGVDVDKLFYAEPISMRRGLRSVTWRGTGSHFESRDYHYEMLSSDLSHKKFVPIVATVRNSRPGDPPPQLIRHQGEEFVYVLHGQLTLLTELYAPLDLSLGDSCYFDSTMGHVLVGRNGEARILWVTSADPADLAAFGAETVRPPSRDPE